MLTIQTLIVILAVVPQTFSIWCCESSLYSSKNLAETVKGATGCEMSTSKTLPRLMADRGDDKKGRDCDYCTIEVFFQDAVTSIPPKEYYLQSCGSFKASDFEYVEAGITPEQLKTPDEHAKEKMVEVDDVKWTRQFSDFGVDLGAPENKDKFIKACKIHKGLSGFKLETKTKEAGFVSYKIATTQDTTQDTFSDTVKDLKKMESVICACFTDNCNGFENMIPKADDLKEEPFNWVYVE